MSKEIDDQFRREYLKNLIEDFSRDQTIQDVGTWLIKDTLDPLPPKHVAVLREWLEIHNKLTIKPSQKGNTHSQIRDTFPYITRLHRDTGMSVEAACKLVCEELELTTDPQNLRRMYDRARTPESRFLSDLVKATGVFKKTATPGSDIRKAGDRLKKGRAAQKKRQNRTQKP